MCLFLHHFASSTSAFFLLKTNVSHNYSQLPKSECNSDVYQHKMDERHVAETGLGVCSGVELFAKGCTTHVHKSMHTQTHTQSGIYI